MGFYGCDDGGFEYLCRNGYRKSAFGAVGRVGNDDVPYIYGICNEFGTEGEFG